MVEKEPKKIDHQKFSDEGSANINQGMYDYRETDYRENFQRTCSPNNSSIKFIECMIIHELII